MCRFIRLNNRGVVSMRHGMNDAEQRSAFNLCGEKKSVINIQDGGPNMCGRFVGFRNLEQLKRYFPIHQAEGEIVANFNVAPGQKILTIIERQGENRLEKCHWGLVPSWAKDKSIGNRMINARSETVADKPSFRSAFRRRRCLIPADGFYEWTGPKGQKQPVYITLPDERPFAFAGLWETWRDGHQSEAVYQSCTIITRQASAAMRKIHHRMPVILEPGAYSDWLDPQNQDADLARALLRDRAITELVTKPVSKRVNTVRNNDADNIRPVQIEFDF